MVEHEDLSKEGMILETCITKRTSCNNLKENLFKQRVQQEQRPCDRNIVGMFKGQRPQCTKMW